MPDGDAAQATWWACGGTVDEWIRIHDSVRPPAERERRQAPGRPEFPLDDRYEGRAVDVRHER
ncbi:hypothetical protein [Streptomyces adonidis]|uniref:Uncharacterized protein n=1 Tax=Streptomyces sp. NBC_00093 TaxID=2975649 RepID=A0AAU2A1A7_9ACTN